MHVDLLNNRFLSPPQVARILRTSADQVHRFIESGELKAINLSLADRPRWKIDPNDLQAFLDRRSNQVATKPEQKRKTEFVKPARVFFK